MCAPVNGLEALVDVAVFIHLAEHTHLVCLEALVHGLVRVLPVADNAQTLEALHLDADILLGVGLAGGAEVGNAHCLVIELLLLDDGAFDRHAVVIPAGDVGRVVAAHCVRAGDEVLDGLVKGVTHMDVAVGERRAVMQVEQRLAFVFLEHFVVNIELLPVLEHIRLTLGKAGSHGEIGLGKIQGQIVFLCHWLLLR